MRTLPGSWQRGFAEGYVGLVKTAIAVAGPQSRGCVRRVVAVLSLDVSSPAPVRPLVVRPSGTPEVRVVGGGVAGEGIPALRF